MLNITIPHLGSLCQKYHIQKMWVFGSVLRDDFTPESDIDLLVEFEPNAPIGLFEMVELRNELETLLQRPVDIGTPKGLSKYIREKVLQSAEVIYERP